MREETFSARFVDSSLAHSVLAQACPDYEMSASTHQQSKIEDPRLAGPDSLLNLLSALSKIPRFTTAVPLSQPTVPG
jgi:hypothetical protein